ncbi:MAG: glycoside hydrolase family 16 protein [Pirellulales bacterium]|nr:glycoside hydrolase family 16 protein [Pirellulales bacterium]
MKTNLVKKNSSFRHLSSIGLGLGIAIMIWAVPIHLALAQLLLRDDFDDFGPVDTTVWRLPFDTEGIYVGRTQFRGNSATDMPEQGIVADGAVDDFVAEILLDTYSPNNPGNEFLGTDLLTKRNYARGGGLTLEARMRLVPPTSGGLVGAFFAYDVTRDSPPGTGNLVRDEIDHELLGNQAVGGSQDVLTNVWNDGPFTGPGSGGSPQFCNLAGFDLTQFHNYKIEWTPQHVQWYVDGMLIRAETSTVPDDPTKLHLNLWAPDSSFADAYNAALQPAVTWGNNRTFYLQIDHVEINRINTNISGNLLVDPSFEELPLINIETSPPATTTGRWIEFNNTFIEQNGVPPGNLIPTVSGVRALKAFGPFHGYPDASGAFQNVEAQPGQEFEASVSAITTSGDNIRSLENFATIAISFLDENGNVLKEAFGDPGNYIDTNGRDFSLLDGRDPYLNSDQWVRGSVAAIAPDGTAFARLSLFFIQLNNQAGSVFYDDVSLIRLSAIPGFLEADFNEDGNVDHVDFAAWQSHFGGQIGATHTQGDADADGDVDGSDFLIWQQQYGAFPFESASIPESSTLVLSSLLALTALILTCCRTGRSSGC